MALSAPPSTVIPVENTILSIELWAASKILGRECSHINLEYFQCKQAMVFNCYLRCYLHNYRSTLPEGELIKDLPLIKSQNFIDNHFYISGRRPKGLQASWQIRQSMSRRNVSLRLLNYFCSDLSYLRNMQRPVVRTRISSFLHFSIPNIIYRLGVLYSKFPEEFKSYQKCLDLNDYRYVDCRKTERALLDCWNKHMDYVAN